MAWTRDKALLTMTAPLGGDTRVPSSLSAQEGISQPFQFDVHAVCQTGKIDNDDLLYQPVCVTVQANGAPVRHFHGIVRSISAEGPVRGQAGASEMEVYRLILVPKLWFLNQTVDCRVYEKKSATDIIKSMCTDAGLTDLTGPPSSSTRDYTIQFNESDFHFATRLMEEEGWFYFFEHTDSKHTLVIAIRTAPSRTSAARRCTWMAATRSDSTCRTSTTPA